MITINALSDNPGAVHFPINAASPGRVRKMRNPPLGLRCAGP